MYVPMPRSGKCDCGGEYREQVCPKPGVAFATVCQSCGKWLRWELERGPEIPK